MRSITILGVRVDNVTMGEAVAAAHAFVRSDGAHMIVTPNPEICLAAQHDAEFRDILNRADLAIPDGFGLLLAARFLGVPMRERVTGTDLLERLAEESAKNGWKTYLLGGEPGIAERASRALERRFPNMLIVGRDAGEEGIVERIRAANPDVVFVALGAVKQEKWIAEYLPQLHGVKVAMGVGGAFDFLSGEAMRAPLFL
ncbi:MAG: WecB/TagA/CpsF family glycosyltransferase, partial [Patescibacteria group bacterium]